MMGAGVMPPLTLTQYPDTSVAPQIFPLDGISHDFVFLNSKADSKETNFNLVTTRHPSRTAVSGVVRDGQPENNRENPSN
jgi:hypothetical protein